MNKVLKRSSYALAAAGLLLPSFAIGTPVYAGGGCVSAASFATEGYVANAEELELAITDSTVSSVKLSNDFAVTCSLSFITKDFTLDLNGKTLTAGAWSIDMEGTSGKTLTIADSAGTGKYVLDSVGKGIWVEGGNTLVISGGAISNTAGQGRAAVVLGGDFRMTGGAINMQNDQQTDSETGKPFYMPAVVLSDSSATIAGGNIRGSYTGIEASGEKTLTVSGGKIEGGDTAISLSEGTLKFEGGALASSDSYVVALFSGATFNMSDGTLTAGDAFALSGNFNAGPIYANISGGTLTSGADYAIYMPGDPEAKSTITISGDPIIKGAGGAIGVNGGNLVIEGGSFESEGKIGTREGSLGNGSYGFHDAVLGLPSAYVDTNVTISGGEFVANGEAELIWTTDICKALGESGTCDLGLAISGGTFSDELNIDYIPEGYDVYQLSEDGPWTVDKKSTIALPEEPIYLRAGETVNLSEYLDEPAIAYATTGFDKTGLKEDKAFQFTGVKPGKYLVNINLHNAIAPVDENIEIVVYEVEANENDDMEEKTDQAAVESFVGAKLKEVLTEPDEDAIYEIDEQKFYNDGEVHLDLGALEDALSHGRELITAYEQDDLEKIEAPEKSLEELKKNSPEEYKKITEALGKGQILAAFDGSVTIYDDEGNYIGEALKLERPITQSFKLPSDAPAVQDGYKRTFFVIRMHTDRMTGETEYKRISVTVDGETGTFENDEFSTFIVAYEDTKVEEDNPNTFDRGIATFAIIGGITVPTLVAAAWFLAKKNS